MSRAKRQLLQDARAAGFNAVEEFGGLTDIRLRDADTNRLMNGARLYRTAPPTATSPRVGCTPIER